MVVFKTAEQIVSIAESNMFIWPIFLVRENHSTFKQSEERVYERLFTRRSDVGKKPRESLILSFIIIQSQLQDNHFGRAIALMTSFQ